MSPKSITVIKLADGWEMTFDNAMSIHKLGRSPTKFEVQVYQAACAIPKGRVSTYGEVAKALHSSSRAVGQALRRNPFAPTVPCHRIVKTDLAIGGFSGTQGQTPEVSKKLGILEKEGIQFNDRIVSSSRFVIRHHELQRLLC